MTNNHNYLGNPQTAIFLSDDTCSDLTPYDHTKLSAVATCPTWGVLRHGMDKNIPGTGRAMALECGTACHQAFAAIRLWQLGYVQKLEGHMHARGVRIFGRDGFGAMVATQSGTNTDRTNAMHFALCALERSGYIDDPNDRRRTMTNMETACIAYLDQWDMTRYPVWVEDESNPDKLVGIEVPYDITIVHPVRVAFQDGTSRDTHKRMRHTGRMDGIHWESEDKRRIIVQENKTTGRIDEPWRTAFIMSHQVTGYLVGASLITHTPVHRALCIGLQIPLPKSITDGVAYEAAVRDNHHVQRWVDWMHWCIHMYEAYRGNPYQAPKFTHSCNRYHRSCPFIPFCYEDDDGMREIVAQMVDDPWNPLLDTVKFGE